MMEDVTKDREVRVMLRQAHTRLCTVAHCIESSPRYRHLSGEAMILYKLSSALTQALQQHPHRDVKAEDLPG